MNTATYRIAVRATFALALIFADIQRRESAFGTYSHSNLNGHDHKEDFYHQSYADDHYYNHLHRYGIHLDGPRRIIFPRTTVTEYPQDVYSHEQRLILSNKNFKKGWLLNGKVFRDRLFGWKTWERIPAELKFKSITWVRGGNGSTAGIRIHPSGEYIEADPNYRRGVYDIRFEVVLRVPAFPYADKYFGVCAFIVQ